MEELHLEEIYDSNEDCKYGVTENKINIFEDNIIIYDKNVIEEYIKDTNKVEEMSSINEDNIHIIMNETKLENEKASKKVQFSYEDMLKSMNLKVNQGKLEYIKTPVIQQKQNLNVHSKRITRGEYIKRMNQHKIVVNSKPNKLFFPEINKHEYDHYNYNEPNLNKFFYVRRK